MGLGDVYKRQPYGLVHFQDSGGLVKPRPGERPLLLLHQSPASTRQFESAFKPLVARGIRFIAVDTPGSVSYTHLTLPPSDLVSISVGAVT